MRASVLKCPNCEATLKLDSKKQDFLYCPYCGSQVYLDEEKNEYTINYNYTKRTINDADIIRAKTEAKKARNERLSAVYCIVALFALIAFCMFMDGFGSKEQRQKVEIAISEGKISAGWHSDYDGKNYLSVQKQLEGAGFTNIELVDLNDVWYFSSKKDTVENVSINGDSSFSSSDYFEKDAKVVISYH